MSRRPKEVASVAANKGDRLAHVLRLGQQVVTRSPTPAPTAAVNRMILDCQGTYKYDDEKQIMEYHPDNSMLVAAIRLNKLEGSVVGTEQKAHDMWGLEVDIKGGNFKDKPSLEAVIVVVTSQVRDAMVPKLSDAFEGLLPLMLPAHKAELTVQLKRAKSGIYQTGAPYGDREKVFDVAIAKLG